MKRRHPVLVVKGMRALRCERAVRDGQRMLRRVEALLHEAQQRLDTLAAGTRALRLRQTAPGGLAAAAEFLALDGQLRATQRALMPARTRRDEMVVALERARAEHASRVAAWSAACESLRQAEARLREQARLARSIADDAAEEEVADTRAARLGPVKASGGAHAA